MKQIQIGDYLFMSCDEKDKERLLNTFIKNESVTFLEYYQFLHNGGFDELENQLFKHFRIQKWPSLSNDDIICSILPKSEPDRINKRKKKDYYIANAYCAFVVLKQIYTVELYNELKNTSSTYYFTYFLILKSIMQDLDQLKNLYSVEIKNDSRYPAYVNRPIHTMKLHNVLCQAVYGNVSFHSFVDYETAAPIAVIRQIIELRIRRAIGVLGYIDESSNNIYPLKMTKVFEIIKKYPDISFPNQLTYLERIYQWSNLYIHSGKGDFAWITFFLENYLRPLSFGNRKSNGNWSCYNAITVTKETLDKIQEDIQKLNPSFQLLTCSPECELLERQD